MTCPKCGGPARRETDTMDTFVDSSWYFFRYWIRTTTTRRSIRRRSQPWFPIDQYIGGVEHAILHLIYSRFWCKVMRDIGLVSVRRAVQEPVHAGHGAVERAKMSKSKGNMVDPDEMVEKYGADTCRLFALFAAPPEKDMDWNESSVEGQYRFLGRVFRFVTRNMDASEGSRRDRREGAAQAASDDPQGDTGFRHALALQHVDRGADGTDERAVRAGSRDVAAVRKDACATLALLLAPFAPFTAEELWELMGKTGPVFKAELAGVRRGAGEGRRGRDPGAGEREGAQPDPVPFGTGEEELEQVALADDKVGAA